MPSKVIRNITKVFRSASGVLFGRATAGPGHGEELTPSDVRALISVYSTSEVDAIIGGIDGLTSTDIDTLSEINAILTDADLASISYVDSGLSGKQATLVSGTNIKTVNSTSLLGSGDIVVSASAAGSSGQVQYNNAGALGAATAVVYAGSGTHMTVTAQAASAVPLCVKGAASQTGNLTEWRNSYGVVIARILDSGIIDVPAIYVDGSQVFDTAGSRLDVGRAGGFDTVTVGGGTSATLQIGGTTSSYPAWKVTSSNMRAIRADGVTDCDVYVTGKIGIGTTSPAAKLDVAGDIFPTTDNTYYLGKNDDDTPKSWKGVILKDTTNGKYYRLEIISGVVTATDLTD